MITKKLKSTLQNTKIELNFQIKKFDVDELKKIVRHFQEKRKIILKSKQKYKTEADIQRRSEGTSSIAFEVLIIN